MENCPNLRDKQKFRKIICDLLVNRSAHINVMQMEKLFRGEISFLLKNVQSKSKGPMFESFVLKNIFVHQVVLFLPHCLQLLGREWQVNTDHGHLERG